MEFRGLPPICQLTDRILHWSRLWGVGHLHTFVDIRYHRRLTRCVGKCYPATGLIWLSVPLLQEFPDELLPTLCHEAAHVAVYLTYGLGRRPHGSEWQALMRQAGYDAARTFKRPPAIPPCASSARSVAA
jgi:SprT-like family